MKRAIVWNRALATRFVGCLDASVTARAIYPRPLPLSSPLRLHSSSTRIGVKDAAQVLRALIQRVETEPDETRTVNEIFWSEHREAAMTIKREGGLKAVSRVYPYLFRWEKNGDTFALSAPSLQEQEEIKKNHTPPIFLEEAFRSAGGSVADMSDLEDEGGAELSRAVAIDIEGEQFSPPLLVQVCPVGSDRVYVEQPSDSGVSLTLTRLLDDPTVVKVFVDGSGDLRSLGVPVQNTVDLQRFVFKDHPEASVTVGGVSRRHHLPSLVDLASEALGKACQKNKRLQRQFGFYNKQRRPKRPFEGNLLWYAAADAWATALVYDDLVNDSWPDGCIKLMVP